MFAPCTQCPCVLRGKKAEYPSSQSTSVNNSRLKILQARNDHLEQLFEDAGKEVGGLESGDKYAQAVEAFILEVRHHSLPSSFNRSVPMLICHRSSFSCSHLM